MSVLNEPDPIRADRRRARQSQRLPDDAACVLCGVSKLDTLTPAPITLVEEHHVIGRRASANVTVPLCRNCHAIQTAAQHDHQAIPPTGRYTHPDSVIERIARALRSLGLFAHELAHTLMTYAQNLFDIAVGLDESMPEWRTEEWAS